MMQKYARLLQLKEVTSSVYIFFQNMVWHQQLQRWTSFPLSMECSITMADQLLQPVWMTACQSSWTGSRLKSHVCCWHTMLKVLMQSIVSKHLHHVARLMSFAKLLLDFLTLPAFRELYEWSKQYCSLWVLQW